ncbi:MAG: SDR family oxidoreductase [Actinomycetota bacterium]
MKILVLGGTKFLGRHFVDHALRSGHEVTIFTRGVTNPNLFPETEHVIGDRDVSLAGLSNRSFDAVIDTCGYHPRPVGSSAREFGDSLYCFVSSISAYADQAAPGKEESAPLASMSGPVPPSFDPEQYGPLKSLCEKTVALCAPRSLIIRPGLIVGPHDPTDRFTYWPVRGSRGGTIVAPVRPDRETQIIDARDLASWMLSLVERDVTGTFNAVAQYTIGNIVSACAALCVAPSSPTEIVWASDEELLKHGVEEWTGLPLWLRENGDFAGMLSSNISKAVEAGLTARPIEDTARDTLEWFREIGRADDSLACGLTAEKEAQIVRALRGR